MKFSNPFKKKQQPMPDDTVRNDEDMQNENEGRYEDFVNQDRDDNYEGRDDQIRDDYDDLSFDRYRETGDLDNPFSGGEQEIDTSGVEKQLPRLILLSSNILILSNVDKKQTLFQKYIQINGINKKNENSINTLK